MRILQIKTNKLRNGLLAGMLLGIFGVSLAVAVPAHADSFGGVSESVRSTPTTSTARPAPAAAPRTVAPAAKPAIKAAAAPAPAPARAVTPRIPASCLTTAKTICIVKGSASRAKLYAIQNKKVVMTSDVRTGDSGGSKTYTRDGVQKVEWKSKNHKSRELNGAPMPDSLFFNELGEAVHYSPTFDKIYHSGRKDWGHSNGCVNIPSRAVADQLFAWAPNSTRVVVTR